MKSFRLEIQYGSILKIYIEILDNIMLNDSKLGWKYWDDL